LNTVAQDVSSGIQASAPTAAAAGAAKRPSAVMTRTATHCGAAASGPATRRRAVANDVAATTVTLCVQAGTCDPLAALITPLDST
jgi:hypothetical protein